MVQHYHQRPENIIIHEAENQDMQNFEVSMHQGMEVAVKYIMRIYITILVQCMYKQQ